MVTGSIVRFFAPQGRHVAPMGVKFGTEEGTLVGWICSRGYGVMGVLS